MHMYEICSSTMKINGPVRSVLVCWYRFRKSQRNNVGQEKTNAMANWFVNIRYVSLAPVKMNFNYHQAQFISLAQFRVVFCIIPLELCWMSCQNQNTCANGEEQTFQIIETWRMPPYVVQLLFLTIGMNCKRRHLYLSAWETASYLPNKKKRITPSFSIGSMIIIIPTCADENGR